ncbi:MAG: TolB family protein [Limisphaerales bacterium]
MRRQFLSFFIGILLLGLPRTVDASHFRFGHLSWQRSAGGNPLAIDVTVVEAWRSNTSGPGSIVYTIDHSGAQFSSLGAAQIGSLTDITGEQYDIFSRTVTLTFPSNGVFTITSSETFRLIDVVNAPASNAKLQLVIDLRTTNTGTPQTTSPVILQLPINTTNLVPIPLVDPDSDPIAVRFATVVESGIPAIPEVGGNPLSVSPSGVLNWNTTGGTVGQRFAVQLAIEENHPGFTTTGKVPLEFIIELVNISTNDPPTCTGPTTTMNAEVGTPLTVSFMATDPEGGPLSVSEQQLPPGAILTPSSGTTNASPTTVELAWVPAFEHLGQSFPVSLLFTDDHGLQAGCGFTITVSSSLPLPAFDLVSVDDGGPRSPGADSLNPVISADGRFVAFESRASDIAANDSNNAIDVFVHDALSNRTFLVSRGTNNTSGSGDSFAPRFSADGKMVVFVSTADDLVTNDTNSTSDVFLRDLGTGTITLVSVSSNGWSGSGATSSPGISTNGRFVVFASAAPDLAPNDANNNTDIFWRDLNNNITTLISANTNGQAGNFISFDPAISPSGDRVAFVSQATDLVGLPDNNAQTDVYFREVFTGSILPVSQNIARSAMGNGGSSTPLFDRSGNNVLFVSIATDLAASDSNGEQDIFL